MKIYILRPKEDLPDSDDPWEPYYDKSFGFIVRANSEKEARGFADAGAGDENCGEKTANPWLDERYTTCEELSVMGDKGVIMMDYRCG